MKFFFALFISTLSTEVFCQLRAHAGPFPALTDDGTVPETEDVAQARALHVAARSTIVAKLEQMRRENQALNLNKRSNDAGASASSLTPLVVIPQTSSSRILDRSGRVKTVRDVRKYRTRMRIKKINAKMRKVEAALKKLRLI